MTAFEDRENAVKIAITVSLCVAGVVFLTASVVLAAGDIASGKKLARKCTTCHTLNKGGRNRLGPNLFGIFGSSAASVKGYKYSKAMVSSGIVWDEAAFTEFLANPRRFVRGTKMAFSGVKNAKRRADLLAYFRSLTDAAPDQKSRGNAAKGKIAAVKQCQVCHSFEKGGKTIYGPNLFGVFGRRAGAVKDYVYSYALSKSGLTWNTANIIEFLANPERFIKGTKARFPGVRSAKMRVDIAAYLKTLK